MKTKNAHTKTIVTDSQTVPKISFVTRCEVLLFFLFRFISIGMFLFWRSNACFKFPVDEFSQLYGYAACVNKILILIYSCKLWKRCEREKYFYKWKRGEKCFFLLMIHHELGNNLQWPISFSNFSSILSSTKFVGICIFLFVSI